MTPVKPTAPPGFSTVAKVAFAVIAVTLIAVVWYAAPTREQLSQPTAPEGATMAPSERVRQRLAQLRAERDAGAVARPSDLFRGRVRELPTPAVKGVQPSSPHHATEPAAPDSELDADMDFDSLKNMALNDQDPENRVAAIWMLASLEDEPVIPVLTQALSDSDSEVRLAAIQSLSDFSDDAPLETLALALDDADPEVRFEALSVVAELDDERAQTLVAKALDDPDEDVRSLAEGIADLPDMYDRTVAAPTPAESE
jgi:hypothetical protein